MERRRGPKLIIVATCAGCEFHYVKPDGRRYCEALNGRRMDHDDVDQDCPHWGELGTVTRSSELVGLRHEPTPENP